MEQHHYNTYSSTRHSNARRTLYLALNKTGQPRKIQIPVNRTLGKLATYTKALTQTVAHDRVERLISRLFGANHVRHGLKQLCETGVLPEVEMRTRPACGGGGQGVAKPAGVNKTPAVAAAGGANKDKDSKDTLRKKKKKRRKCREDETPGEHCFRPATSSSSSSGSSLVGTNSNRRRVATPPGQAKSQHLRCGGDEGECVDSPSSSSPNNSANSVSSSNSNRASTTVPNDGGVGGPKKKVAKKVNNRNAPPNVNSKKPKGGGGGPGGPGGGGPKKAKQQTSISSSTVPLAAKGKVKAMTSARTTPRTTTARSTTTTTPSPTPSTTPFNLDDTSQSEDEELAALDMDELAALHQLSSAEIIEEDELDEGNPSLTGQSLNFVDEEDLNDMDF